MIQGSQIISNDLYSHAFISRCTAGSLGLRASCVCASCVRILRQVAGWHTSDCEGSASMAVGSDLFRRGCPDRPRHRGPWPASSIPPDACRPPCNARASVVMWSRSPFRHGHSACRRAAVACGSTSCIGHLVPAQNLPPAPWDVV